MQLTGDARALVFLGMDDLFQQASAQCFFLLKLLPQQGALESSGDLVTDRDQEAPFILLPGGVRAIERLEMVDVVFLAKGRPELLCLWEVENSTNFTSAIQRGSNAPRDVPKFMVIPEDREQELLAISDPSFPEQFAINGWRYLTYPEVKRLASHASVSLRAALKTAKGLSHGG